MYLVITGILGWGAGVVSGTPRRMECQPGIIVQLLAWFFSLPYQLCHLFLPVALQTCQRVGGAGEVEAVGKDGASSRWK